MIAGGPVREGRPIGTNHAAACRDTEGVELVAACDPDADRRARFAATWGLERVYGDLATMLVDERLDVLIVATPPEHHEASCLAALDHGVRGILCEKPFTGEGAAAGRVAAACAARHVPLLVNFSRRWDVSHQELARRIAGGAIGDVRAAHGTYTGTLRGNGSHLVDTLRMMTARRWSIAHASRLPPSATDGPVSLVLEDGGGAEAHLVPVRDAAYFVFELTLLGTNGRARLAFQGRDVRLDEPRPHPQFPGYLYLQEAERLGDGTLMHAFPRALGALADAVRSATSTSVTAEDFVPTLVLLDEAIALATSKEPTS
jgi:predicted dehydrogenase